MKLILLSEEQIKNVNAILNEFIRNNANKPGFVEVYSDIVSIQASLAHDVSFHLIDQIKTQAEVTDSESVAKGLMLAKDMIEKYTNDPT